MERSGECIWYARRGDGVEECLEDHLLLVGIASAVITRYLRIDGVEAAALLAGVAHDWGKLLFNLTRREETRLSFPYHEFLSAAILYHASRSCCCDGGVACMYAVRAVMLHHQGLRGVEYATLHEAVKFLSNELRRVEWNKLAEEYGKLLQMLHKRIGKVEGGSIELTRRDVYNCRLPGAKSRESGGLVSRLERGLAGIRDATKQAVKLLECMSKVVAEYDIEYVIDLGFRGLLLDRSLGGRSKRETTAARGVAAAVMLADKVVASCAAGGRELGSVYGRAALYTLEKAVQWA